MTTQTHNHDPSTKRSLAVDIVQLLLKEKQLKIHTKNLIKLLE